MKEQSPDPVAEFRAVNVEPLQSLARAAAEHGVGRFVFLSSIKVNGESTTTDPYDARSTRNPLDPYAVSKAEGEVALESELGGTDVELVIVRTPLVYGPGVGGNFARMLRLVSKELPLPLGSIRNRRTMVSIWNLSDLLSSAASESAASSAIVVAGDPTSPSTPELLRMLAKCLGVRSRVFSFPTPLLHAAGTLTGQSQEVRRLTDSLEVVAGSSTSEWVWRPKLSLEDGICRTAAWYTDTVVGVAE
jgi:nucleoside-diphosphate-sugar epimerase